MLPAAFRDTHDMGKFAYFFVASVAIAFVVYNKNANDVEPEVMTEDDVWWGPESTRKIKENSDIRPFQIDVSAEVIGDLKRRLSNSRLTAQPLENINFEYGFNRDYLAKIIDHWLKRYDWTARQAYLNTIPQFKTNVYGLDLHFLHVKPVLSEVNVRTIPLLLVHGWPGSVAEFYKIIPMLTTPRSGEKKFVFEVIAPSLPGYGFSDAPARPGLGPAQIGQAFVKLMERLGHKKFYVQGGDWGAAVVESISKIFPNKVYGMHSNFCSVLSSLSLRDFARLTLGTYWPSLVVSSETEKFKTYPLSKLFSTALEESGYMHLQMTKPDTVGVGVDDSPAALAAYILEKFSSGTNLDNRHLPDGGLSVYKMDELLDNVMIYWVTGSMTTSMRLYSEFGSKKYQALPHLKAKVKVPTACALFPHELSITLSLKKLLKSKYLNLVRATEMQAGGHFAAFEQPKLLAEDIWLSVLEMEKIRNST